jgi:hypothetical protein
VQPTARIVAIFHFSTVPNGVSVYQFSTLRAAADAGRWASPRTLVSPLFAPCHRFGSCWPGSMPLERLLVRPVDTRFMPARPVVSVASLPSRAPAACPPGPMLSGFRPVRLPASCPKWKRGELQSTCSMPARLHAARAHAGPASCLVPRAPPDAIALRHAGPAPRHGVHARPAACCVSACSSGCACVAAHPPWPRRPTQRGNELPPIDTIPVGVHSVGRHGLLCWQGAADRPVWAIFRVLFGRTPFWSTEPLLGGRRLTQAVGRPH